MKTMIRTTRVLAVALALSACGGTGAGTQWPDSVGGDGQLDAGSAWAGGGDAETAPVPVHAGTGQLAPVQIMDEAGFGSPRLAYTVQVPAGWRMSGGVRWENGDVCSGGLQVAWTATAPDGIAAFRLVPAASWQVQGTELPTNPCPAAPYRSVRAFLESVAAQFRPDARVLDYMDWPEGVARMEQAAQGGGIPDAGQQRRIEAGHLLIGYTLEGVEIREVLSSGVSFSSFRGNTTAASTEIVANRARNGQLDVGLADRIAMTIQPDPQWMADARQRVTGTLQRYYAAQRQGIDQWHEGRMAQINARGEADRAGIRAQTQREVAGIYARTHANTVATNDGMHRRGLEAIGEYDTYAGNGGGTVQSSIHGGSRVFQDNDNPNNAWSTHDPYYQPSNATELERIP
ncbi:hypothetical protein FQY83_16660 [Luteimonas marina]|uniref:Lipoprotein n=1 Tax=Luteimonas marina TaxID=488485 RepID=A0A5C5TWD8_9GAMM|nr:hypothetical protein [Luteimonas marina]TWT17555.1 hypothetical protein FQY83_16660 [Luteimonas marina]